VDVDTQKADTNIFYRATQCGGPVSVCRSVTSRYCIKLVKRSITKWRR